MRIGFASAREGARHFYTHRVELPKEPQVGVVRMRALLGPLVEGSFGLATADREIGVPRGAGIPVQAGALSSIARSVGFDVHPIVVIPGARWPSKRWPVERFVEIIRRLLAQKRHVVLAGSPDERELCDQITTQLGDGALIDLAGQTSLAELVALLSRAQLVVANDSGALHVAAALGRPVVALYGPTDPNFVGPYGQLEYVLRSGVDCQPCRHTTCKHHSCMVDITVDRVWAKIQERLA